MKWGLNGNSTVTGFHTDFSAIGNYFKKGPNSSLSHHEITMDPDGQAPGTWSMYVKGNIGPYRTNDTQPDSDSVDPADRRWMVSSPTFPTSGVRSTSASQAYEEVLAKAGARVPTLRCRRSVHP